MDKVMSYSGIVAKLKAMQAKLLTDEDFETIAGMHTVPEVIEYLKETPSYEPYIGPLDASLHHRRHIEKVLIQSLYDDYTKVFRFAGIEQKKFMKFYIKRYEVDLVNYCLRIVFNHYDWPFDLDYKRDFFDRYSQLKIDKLITSNSPEELVENLKDTEYYEPLSRIKNTENPTLFDYDLALDLYSFSSIWKSRKRTLAGKELELFTKDVGTAIDLMNLQWIYRAKKYYNMLPPDIYAIVLPIHYRLKIENFKALVEAPSVTEFLNVLSGTYYAKRYNLDGTKTLEQLYKECMIKLYMSDRRNNPYSVASINTYFFQKENEIDKLTAALECIRYDLSKGETLNYIGGVIH
ncbi:V/A-type H+-transporting ATPase subunit C [Lachnospiraceae bacterium PF1-21]|uniref:V-type ATPase subunit n=1 Tax=Ohessyouella blattaphilus TaxID=2949333 RepID=A0ABT1EIF1_9FIRM|nr:V-type ATPase subunit [Ohessyouella blattaphilus]MCP1110484.1 V-type ATPase subunit [Ohessyouella blattaphilus]MCR8563878.1 V-type ATPase subunit [Ohessyouella blattaphilus]